MGKSKAYKAGADWFQSVGHREAPLSGEWSGESMPEIGDWYGIDLSDSGVADDFEDGFYTMSERFVVVGREGYGKDAE